jgi:hypothetical protein
MRSYEKMTINSSYAEFYSFSPNNANNHPCIGNNNSKPAPLSRRRQQIEIIRFLGISGEVSRQGSTLMQQERIGALSIGYELRKL